MYSRPLLLTSTRTSPAIPRVELQTSAPSLAHRARRVTPPMRHCRYPSDSETEEKPAPYTVTGVPPSARTRAGETLLTDIACWYVKDAPVSAYCCPFIDSCTAFAPIAWSGVAHSS